MKKHYVAPLVAAIRTGVEVGFCGSIADANFGFESDFTGKHEVED